MSIICNGNNYSKLQTAIEAELGMKHSSFNRILWLPLHQFIYVVISILTTMQLNSFEIAWPKSRDSSTKSMR